MEIKVKTIFEEETLSKIPIFYRFMTEYETEKVEELKVGARYSKCKRHFSTFYLQYNSHKPVGEVDLTNIFKK